MPKTFPDGSRNAPVFIWSSVAPYSAARAAAYSAGTPGAEKRDPPSFSTRRRVWSTSATFA